MNDKKFCKKCGSPLDESKKCTSCGKQYFYPLRFIKNLQPKYCKRCGGLIDDKTCKCTSCDKKYFNPSKILNKYTIIITSIILTVVLLFSTFLIVTQKRYSDEIIIDKSISVSPGSMAHIDISGIPNTKYNITVTYKDGAVETTGVDAKTTNSSGNTGWRWYVSKYTVKGICKVRIESEFDYTTTTIMIN